MSNRSIKNAYRRYAGIYDRLFGSVFAEGRRKAVELGTATPGMKVLEVGVGTGLSLPDYGNGAEVWGIDLSEPMLQKARDRVEREGLTHVRDLAVMNAEATSFDDATFDTVVAMYVASVVGNPARMFREMARICKPGGNIIVVNHFASTHWAIEAVEKAFAPISGLIGFRPDYSMAEMLSDARMPLVSVSRVNWFGYWKLAHFHNLPLPPQNQTAHPQMGAHYLGTRLEVDPEHA